MVHGSGEWIAGPGGAATGTARIISISVGGASLGWVVASGNFVRYLRWRTTAAGRVLKGRLRVGAAEIYYRGYDQVLPILLLPGGLSHRLSWFSQVPWLVDSGRQVILRETCGHSASGLGDSELS